MTGTPTIPRTTVHPVIYWMSPQESYEHVSEIVDMAKSLAPVVPGFTPAVALPVCYGEYLQGEMERPQYRMIGDELAPNTFEGIAELRGAIEAEGINCWGWSVPRGNTRSNYSEGYKHGQCASLFPHGFILNTEWGWDGFWTTPQDPGSWTDFASGFWDAIRDMGMSQRLGGSSARVGATFVVNIQPNGSLGAMLNASNEDFDKAVMDSVGFLAAETYGPLPDGGLDPAKDIPWLQGYAERLGFSGPSAKRVVGIMEPKPDGSIIGQLTDWDMSAKYGGHVWTLKEMAGLYNTGPQFPPDLPPEDRPDVSPSPAPVPRARFYPHPHPRKKGGSGTN